MSEIVDIITEIRDRSQNSKYSALKLSPEFIGIRYVDEIPKQVDEKHLQYGNHLPFAASKCITSEILSSKTLAQGDDIKTVYEITLNCGDTNQEYYPGDTIGILAKNSSHDVDFVLNRLKETANGWVEVIVTRESRNPQQIPSYIPRCCELRRLLTECLNLHGISKKLFLRMLATHCCDDGDRKFLEYLSSKEGAVDYKVMMEANISFIDILKECPSCQPPVGLLIQYLPRLMPRPYSIVNSRQTINQNQIKIIFSMNDTGKQKGIVTGMLEEQINVFNKAIDKSKVEYYFRTRSKFYYHPEEDMDKNIIMICAGTAIAPFIGLLDYRKPSNANTWLILGIRHKERNHLYSDLLEKAKKTGVLNKLTLACSRDKNYPITHVQKAIEDNKEEIGNCFFSENTKILICGGGNRFCPGIQRAIQEAIMSTHNLSEVEANEHIIEGKLENRYVEDLWI